MTRASSLPGPNLLDDPTTAMPERIAWRAVLDAADAAEDDASLGAEVRRVVDVWWELHDLPEPPPGALVVLVTGMAGGVDYQRALRDITERAKRETRRRK